MSGQIRYSDAFKIDAVAQVTERACSIKEVAERLSISTKPLYTWMAQSSKPQRVTHQEGDGNKPFALLLPRHVRIRRDEMSDRP